MYVKCCLVHPSCLSRVVKMYRVLKDLSLAQKFEIFDKIKLQPLDCITRRLSEILEVPKSTITRIQLPEQLF